MHLYEFDTGRFIFLNSVPKRRKLAYYSPQLQIKFKDSKLQYRVQGIIGGDQIYYQSNVAPYIAIIETIHVLLNFPLSEDAFILTADIKDLYLTTPLGRPEYR